MSKSVLMYAITEKAIVTTLVSIPVGSYLTNVRSAPNDMFEITWNGIPIWVAAHYFKFLS